MKIKVKKNRKTVRGLKNFLPIGLEVNEQHGFIPKDNSFKFKDWGFEEEEKIAKLKNEESSSGVFATKVLSLMLDELGGLKWDKLGEIKAVILNQMNLADMLYMYIYLRVESLGSEFAFSNLVCPFCNYTHEEYVVDLKDLDVDCMPEGEKPSDSVDYKLLKPIKYSHVGPDKKPIEEVIESFKICRSKWNVMETITGETASNEALTKKVILKGSIVGYNDSIGFVDAENMIGKLRKIDFERLDRVISNHNHGPTIVVSDKCKNCNKSWNQQINWSYDYFFGSSSLATV